MGKLQGKLAVVTGGTTGIGFATAKRFVDEGAYVFITGRRQKELDEAVKAIGSGVAGVRGDVSKLQDLDRLYETVKAKGKIDVLVANAGTGEFAPLASLTEEHFDRLFDLNVKGTLFTVQKALPQMNDGGSIILVGSVASVKGTASFGTYGATKAAVRNLVRTWTVELKDRRIRSNVLSPGPIKTPLVDLQPPEAIARILTTIPMGRLGEPDEDAKAAVFQASDDCSFVTGLELFVDSGRGPVSSAETARRTGQQEPPDPAPPKEEEKCSQVTPVFSACRKPLCPVLGFSGSLRARCSHSSACACRLPPPRTLNWHRTVARTGPRMQRRRAAWGPSS